MNKLRTLLAAAGLGFFIDTAMAQEDTEYSRINDVPLVTEETLGNLTAEGFRVILIYNSNQNNDSYGDINRGIRVYIRILNEQKFIGFRYDTERLFQEGLVIKAEEVSDILNNKFNVTKRPSIVAFCNGVQTYALDGSAPKDESKMEVVNSYLVRNLSEAKKNCLEQ